MNYPPKKKLGPPPRWINCPRKGQLIVGKFLPFKTPLDHKYDDMIPEYSQFNIGMLFSSLKTMKIKMGLLIDLTNTKRFYDSREVEKNECRYVKLQCRGHGETPEAEQTQAFIELCARFISQKPLEVVGVHCTHGFNRTGFLIAAYLVEKMSWSIEAAVQMFSQSRPPGIYKQDYLQEIFSRYGEKEDTPSAPPLPEWCDEEETEDDNGNTVGDGDAGRNSFRDGRGDYKNKREFVKKGAKFMEGVQDVNQVCQQPRLSQVQKKCQEMCEWRSSGFPGSQPVSMDINNLNFIRQKPYKVSWKADGTRYMMLVDGVNEVYMIDRDNSVFHVPHLEFPRRKDLNSHIRQTLMDGEMILDKVEGKTVPRYLVYDIIKFEGKEVGKTDFGTRLVCIEKEIIGPRYVKIQQGQLDKTKESFSVRAKPFWDCSVSRKILDGSFASQVSHEVDGLVFQPVPDAYSPGRCDCVLKWKPPDQNSIDFKLKITKENKPGMLPMTKAYLFVLGSDLPLFEMKYTKDLKELDGKIIECNWTGREWKFMRQRTDKSFPNSIKTAKGVWESIQHPVTKEILFNACENERWMPPPKSSSSRDNELMPPPKKPRQ